MNRVTTKLVLLLCATAWLSSACGEEVAEGTLNVDNPTGTIEAGTIDPRVVGAEMIVQVPSGAESVALVVRGLGNNLLQADKVTSPSGKVVLDFADVADNKTEATDNIYTLILPNTPAVNLESGDWKVSFVTDAASPLEITVEGIFKTAPASAKTLDLNLFFVGEVEGLTAEVAQSDEDFQKVISDFGEVYGQAGISVGNVNFLDITGADADRFNEVDFGDAERLIALSSGFDLPAQSLSFFFVADLTDPNSDFSQLGVSPGLPGPPTIQGTERSGVVVNLLGFRDDPRDAVTIMAHEGGHFLGLYHTTEVNGAALNEEGKTGSDHLSDTEVCPDEQDGNGDTLLSASECEDFDGTNIMFTGPGKDSPRLLTSQQGQVLVKNPVIK